ncbi:hypothetical protein ACFV1N_44250 [Streptosporangium canum]|uniref:hypothetical protein n=1 Tax=Streptosporangium canum TaxID=324952 RepID=UPI0036B69475
MTIQEQVVSGEHCDAVLYLDRTLRITYSPAPPEGAVRLIGELDATNTRTVARTLNQARAAEDTLRMLTGLYRDGVAHLTDVPTGMRRLLDRADVLDECV